MIKAIIEVISKILAACFTNDSYQLPSIMCSSYTYVPTPSPLTEDGFITDWSTDNWEYIKNPQTTVSRAWLLALHDQPLHHEPQTA